MMFVVLGVAAGVLCAFLRYPFFSLAAAGASLATGAVLHAEREISAAGASAVATETQKAQAARCARARKTLSSPLAGAMKACALGLTSIAQVVAGLPSGHLPIHPIFEPSHCRRGKKCRSGKVSVVSRAV